MGRNHWELFRGLAAMEHVSIIIVHYNTFELTSNCITSILSGYKNIETEIILVDNASAIDDGIRLRKMFPSIKYIRSEINLGFAKGVNLGITSSTWDYILVLNSDTVLKNNVLKGCIEYLSENARCGVVTCRLVFPNGILQHNCQCFPSILLELLLMFRLNHFMSRRKRGRFFLGAFFSHDEDVKPDWIWGTFILFRKSILRELPGQRLDDSFFMYGEDIQWCHDISRLGYYIQFLSGYTVIHEMGASSPVKISQRELSKVESSFIRRNHGRIYCFIWTMLRTIHFATLIYRNKGYGELAMQTFREIFVPIN